MSGLCGWLSVPGGQGFEAGALPAMAACLTRFDRSAVRSVSTGLAAVAAALPDGHAQASKDRRTLVALSGRSYFLDPELAQLAQRDGLPHALLHGFSREGASVLSKLAGSFTLAIVNDAAGEALIAVDRAATRPLCYAADTDRLVFASTLDAIAACGAAEVDAQAIYDYVHFHTVPAPRTIHAGRRRLLPGTFLLWRAGTAEVRRYWQLRFIEDERRPQAELKGQFMQVLRESVERAAPHGRSVGAFLSGGTDSSTIAGVLTKVTGQAARTYSIGFEAQGYDEMAYARIAARHFGTRHHEYYVTPDDVVDAIPSIAAVHDQPFGNASAVPTYYCAKLATEDGVETLIAGDGGDELFGGNARYATQRIYSLYGDLPRTLRKRLIEPAAYALPESIGLVAKLQRYMATACLPMPARYDHYNLLKRLGAPQVFSDDFLAGVDPGEPDRLLAADYAQAHASALINKMLALDFKYTLADNDLVKVRRSCELAGVEVQFPMLDDAMVDFSARLAPDLKLNGARLRYFFKKALRDFLPAEIIEKKKHGFGLPFGTWLQSHGRLQQLAFDSLADLKRRNIVRPAFIDALRAEHVAAHPAYFGTMVWVLMMLEQWHQRRGGVGNGRVAASERATRQPDAAEPLK